MVWSSVEVKPAVDIKLLPTVYEVSTIGAGQLSVMAKPVGGEWIEDEFCGLQQLGIDHVVSLLEPAEQVEVGLANEGEVCAKFGMRYTSFPIVDREVPRKADALALVDALYCDIRSGEHAVIHCRAGIGRTGVIASAVLVRDGYSPGAAMHLVSFARGILVPDTQEQDDWIRSLAPPTE